jgi:hypothetical protein
MKYSKNLFKKSLIVASYRDATPLYWLQKRQELTLHLKELKSR